MAEKVPITCPECAKKLQVPAEIVGRKIRCKGCGKTFVAEKAKGGPAKKAEEEAVLAVKAEDDDDEGDGLPYEVTSLHLSARCPECANEMESEDAEVCLFCGFNLRTRVAVRKRRIKHVTGQDRFMWLLPGILCALSILVSLGLIIWAIVSYLLWDPQPPPEAITRTFANCCTVWWCLSLGYGIYRAGRFAIKRLIFDNQPPEEEIL